MPGAILIMRQGQRSNHFTIEYDQSEEREATVLFYDDRRQKFVFRPVVFACGVNPEGMLTSERYNKLNGQKRLEESDRKKTDQVVASAFEYSSQRTTQGYYALLDRFVPGGKYRTPVQPQLFASATGPRQRPVPGRRVYARRFLLQAAYHGRKTVIS